MQDLPPTDTLVPMQDLPPTDTLPRTPCGSEVNMYMSLGGKSCMSVEGPTWIEGVCRQDVLRSI